MCFHVVDLGAPAGEGQSGLGCLVLQVVEEHDAGLGGGGVVDVIPGVDQVGVVFVAVLVVGRHVAVVGVDGGEVVDLGLEGVRVVVWW